MSARIAALLDRTQVQERSEVVNLLTFGGNAVQILARQSPPAKDQIRRRPMRTVDLPMRLSHTESYRLGLVRRVSDCSS